MDLTGHALDVLRLGALVCAVLLPVMGVIAWAGTRGNHYGPQPDPLTTPVPPLGDTDDPWAIPVALDEHGHTVHLPLIDTHLLVAGASGSGKGSVLWSLVCGIQPMVDAGLARIWGIDAKGGMELRIGEELFDFVVDNPADAATVLEQAATSMNRRTLRLAGRRVRMHTPTPDEPLIVIVIDELADLLDGDDPATNTRIHRSLRSLLRKGRAPLVVLIGCTQDARKAVIPDRDLWIDRVALRTNEAAQAILILGEDAKDRGAATHRIPRDLRGVGYLMTGGRMRRVRFSHITDEYIRDTVAYWTADLDDTGDEPHTTPPDAKVSSQ